MRLLESQADWRTCGLQSCMRAWVLSLHRGAGTEQPSGREALESLWMPARRAGVLPNLTLTHLVSHLGMAGTVTVQAPECHTQQPEGRCPRGLRSHSSPGLGLPSSQCSSAAPRSAGRDQLFCRKLDISQGPSSNRAH